MWNRSLAICALSWASLLGGKAAYSQVNQPYVSGDANYSASRYDGKAAISWANSISCQSETNGICNDPPNYDVVDIDHENTGEDVMTSVIGNLSLPEGALPNGGIRCPLATNYYTVVSVQIGGEPDDQHGTVKYTNIYTPTQPGVQYPTATPNGTVDGDGDVSALLVFLDADCSSGAGTFPVFEYAIEWSIQYPAGLYSWTSENYAQYFPSLTPGSGLVLNVNMGQTFTDPYNGQTAFTLKLKDGPDPEEDFDHSVTANVSDCEAANDPCIPWGAAFTGISRLRYTTDSNLGGSTLYYPMLSAQGKTAPWIFSSPTYQNAWDEYTFGGEGGPAGPNVNVGFNQTWADYQLVSEQSDLSAFAMSVTNTYTDSADQCDQMVRAGGQGNSFNEDVAYLGAPGVQPVKGGIYLCTTTGAIQHIDSPAIARRRQIIKLHPPPRSAWHIMTPEHLAEANKAYNGSLFSEHHNPLVKPHRPQQPPGTFGPPGATTQP